MKAEKLPKRKEVFNSCMYWIKKCGLREEHSELRDRRKLIRHLYSKFPNELENKKVSIHGERTITNYVLSLTK